MCLTCSPCDHLAPTCQQISETLNKREGLTEQEENERLSSAADLRARTAIYVAVLIRSLCTSTGTGQNGLVLLCLYKVVKDVI